MPNTLMDLARNYLGHMLVCGGYGTHTPHDTVCACYMRVCAYICMHGAVGIGVGCVNLCGLRCGIWKRPSRGTTRRSVDPGYTHNA